MTEGTALEPCGDAEATVFRSQFPLDACAVRLEEAVRAEEITF